MNKIAGIFLLLISSYVSANSLSLDATECKLMSGTDTIEVKPGMLCIPERNDHQFRPHLIADSGNT